MLGGDERDAPLAVDHHRQLAPLERVRGGELVACSGVPADELVVAVVVDEALLPAQQPRPGGILRQDDLPAASKYFAAASGWYAPGVFW